MTKYQERKINNRQTALYAAKAAMAEAKTSLVQATTRTHLSARGKPIPGTCPYCGRDRPRGRRACASCAETIRVSKSKKSEAEALVMTTARALQIAQIASDELWEEAKTLSDQPETKALQREVRDLETEGWDRVGIAPIDYPEVE